MPKSLTHSFLSLATWRRRKRIYRNKDIKAVQFHYGCYACVCWLMAFKRVSIYSIFMGYLLHGVKRSDDSHRGHSSKMQNTPQQTSYMQKCVFWVSSIGRFAAQHSSEKRSFTRASTPDIYCNSNATNQICEREKIYCIVVTRIHVSLVEIWRTEIAIRRWNINIWLCNRCSMRCHLYANSTRFWRRTIFRARNNLRRLVS